MTAPVFRIGGTYPPAGPPVMFVLAPTFGRGIRVACSVCDARGYRGGRWEWTHRRGHHRCPCGRWLTARLDGSPRRHARCPLHRPQAGDKPGDGVASEVTPRHDPG